MGPVRNVDDLMAVGHGYQRSMILLAALKLGVFRALAGGACDAKVLARRVGADAEKLSILLDALAALGLLEKGGSRYRNAKPAHDFLLPGPRSKESILLHHLDGWGAWGRLPSTIRAGRKPRGGAQGTWHENFIHGMEENALERAAAVARGIPLRPGERVLDLGGGPGTYAVAWAAASPDAVITVFDAPETLRVTRKILREKGEERRVRLLEGDFLVDPIGGPYDFVWISQILHAYSEGDCRKLLRRVRAALAPGGRVAVQEFLL
ncbi:MAG: methyltransferase domain-containing protein, partial [Deltaproteobacteria bacterium]|nr:methyltransferase domain-containing protein [Deltaproteobacteria bacterium]